jgi:hypothetical protein
MDERERSAVVERLAEAFGDARDVTPAPGQPLHVLLPHVVLPEPWTPTPARALTVWADWPHSRPAFYIDATVTGETGQPPRNPSATYLLGETWSGFSFSFAWSGNDPTRAARTWLTRFEVERT